MKYNRIIQEKNSSLWEHQDISISFNPPLEYLPQLNLPRDSDMSVLRTDKCVTAKPTAIISVTKYHLDQDQD